MSQSSWSLDAGELEGYGSWWFHDWTLHPKHDSQRTVLYTLGLMSNLCGCCLIYKGMIVGTERIQVTFLQQCLAQKVLVIVVSAVTNEPPRPDSGSDLNYRGREGTLNVSVAQSWKRQAACWRTKTRWKKMMVEEGMIGNSTLIGINWKSDILKKLFIYLFAYFWLCWVFCCKLAFSSVTSRGYSRGSCTSHCLRRWLLWLWSTWSRVFSFQ